MSRSTNVAPLLIDSRDWPRVAAAITECQLGFFFSTKNAASFVTPRCYLFSTQTCFSASSLAIIYLLTAH